MNKTNDFMQDGKIVKKFTHRNNPPENLDITKEFVNELVNITKGKNISITTWRLIWGLFAQLKGEQFNARKRPKQLSLFEEELLSEHGQFSTVKIKNSDINPSRTKGYIEKSIEFLMQMPSQRIEMEREDGRKIKVWTRPIMSASTEDRGYTELILSSYWVKKIIDLTKWYDSIYYKTLIQLKSSNSIELLLWLLQLKLDDSPVTLKFFNKRFELNYSSCKNLSKGFLKPIKEELDSKSMVSFNYSYNETKSIFSIVRYNNKNINLIPLKETEKKIIDGKYYANQYKKKHELTKEQYESILGYLAINHYPKQKLLLDAYRSLKKECRIKKTSINDLKGITFIDIYQEHIKQLFLITREGERFPGNYPNIKKV